MKSHEKLLFLILITLYFTGCAGDAQLRKDLASYRPPESRQSMPVSVDSKNMTDPLSGPGSASAHPFSENGGLRLVESLKPDDSKKNFYEIEDRLRNKLSKAADDQSFAASVLEKSISLENLKALAILRNPGVQAAEKRVRAERESFTQVNNLDEVLRQYAAFTEGLMTGVGPMRGKETMKMQFPFPGVTALKGRIVQAAVASARENLEIIKRDAITDITNVFWELTFIEKAREVTSETLKLLKDLESVADTRYRSGTTSYQDITKIRIRTGILEEELKTIAESEKNLKAKIIELINLEPDIRLGKTEPEKPEEHLPSLETLYVPAGENRQEIQRLKAEIKKVEQMIEMSETMIYPTYTLGFSFYEDDAILKVGTDAMEPTFPTTTASAMGKGLPKSPWYGTQDPWLRQTRLKLDAMNHELDKTRSMTRNQVRNAWFMLDKAIREHALYRDRILGLSRSALDVTTRGYESGTVSFTDVISSHTTWLEVNLAAARKRSDIGIARANLERAVGTGIRNFK